MIYESVDAATPIRQGDIFRNVPRVDISLNRMHVVARENGNTQALELDWVDALDETYGCRGI